MADSKISALSAASSLADADVLAIVNGGSTKKVTLNTLTAYFEQRARQNNASTAAQGAGFATDTYVTGSDVSIPDGRLQAKAKYNLRIALSRTAAGTGTPTINLRVGTAGTTADASRCLFTWPGALTATGADNAWFEIMATFRSVGSGTSAVIQGGLKIERAIATASQGFGAAGMLANHFLNTTGGGFDSTVSGLKIGASINGGTGAAWTITQVDAVLSNLA